MLKVVHEKQTAEIRFYYEILDRVQIEARTGKRVDKNRRCSFVTITMDDGRVYQGMAICHSNDNFCRATGRKRALADALKYTPEGPIQKDFRTAIWNAYKVSCRI